MSEGETILSQPIDVGGLNNLVPHEAVVSPCMIVGDDHDHIRALVRERWEMSDNKRKDRH